VNTKDSVEVLRKEEEEMSRFLIAFETALQLAAKGEDEARLLGLRQLHEMAVQNAKIHEHCRLGTEALNSSPFLLADNEECARLRQSYLQLERTSFEFRNELVFTTTSSTENLVAQGQHLRAVLREHIVYEGQLLKRIEAVALRDPMGPALAGTGESVHPLR